MTILNMQKTKQMPTNKEEILIHESAICESSSIGQGTRIWAFVHILSGARIGQDCNICDFVYIENEVVIGDRTTIKSGVQLWDGVTIGSNVFIGPNVTFTNDKNPISENADFELMFTKVSDHVSIGANSTILPGLSIGEHAVIGAGSVVTRNVLPYQKVFGNPATVV